MAKLDQTIRIVGARQHNLKNFDLELPLNELTVITGPSGSGKSSLAFHTLYAEGQRRYVETFSPYVRQFLDRMDKPAVDRIDGIPPAIAVEQKNAIRTTRSTVGTLTELNDYLKVIYPNLAKAYDPETGEEISPDTAQDVSAQYLRDSEGEALLVLFPLKGPTEGDLEPFLEFLNQQGYMRLWVDGEIVRTDEPGSLTHLPEPLLVIQDRMTVSTRNRSRLNEALEAAFQLGKGTCYVHSQETLKEYSTRWKNPSTGLELRAPSSAMFSFNSPLGACEHCRGFGRVIGIDLWKAIPNQTISLRDGCVKPFQTSRGEECQDDLIRLAGEVGVDIDCAFEDLDEEAQDWVLYGDRGEEEETWPAESWYGVKGFFDWLETKAYKMHVRVFLSRYRAYTACPDCQGKRLKSDALCFKIDQKALPDLWQMPVLELLEWVKDIQPTEKKEEEKLGSSTKLALAEILSRLNYLNEVGLGYLTLDRAARTLSGGEIERVNLTTCLGADLTNTLFVLDEPTVGLHARDIHRLTKVMKSLRDKGNTVVVVEHEEAVMRQADRIIDMGPAAGEAGGNIVANVSARQLRTKTILKKHPNSTTLPYLVGEKKIALPAKRSKTKAQLKLKGARKHNIKKLDVEIPLELFVCVTGVSGSGKSTLAHDILYLNLVKLFGQATEEEPAFMKSLRGYETLDGVELVDQSPLTKTPRSTPAVYSGAFDAMRELIALSEDGVQRGLKAGYFSFNSGDGRCERCFGNGFEKVEMQFLSDLYISCPECEGTRYHSVAKEVQLRGKNIADLLAMTVREACEFFTIPKGVTKGKQFTLHRKIQEALSPMLEVGLGYLRMGQPLNTLSGGESQRLKLCQLLTKSKGVERKLLILDEPTTGLHFEDIEKLLAVFGRLTEKGHSLLVIEHNLDVIAAADYVLEMGPGAGTHGGEVVYAGTLEEMLNTDTEVKTETAKALRGFHDEEKQVDDLTYSKDSAKVKQRAKNSIHLHGAREHNLKDFDLSIPRDQFVVVSGLSGSGKSTLSFDIIFAEGQRRFLDSMSPYARQFAGQMEKPDIDKIEGLPPTVAIEQRVSRGGGKSTVGTVTEIYHFLRLLYARLGIQHCPDSGEAVVSQISVAIFEQMIHVFKKHPKAKLLASLVRSRKGYHTDVAAAAGRMGIKELLVDGAWVEVDEFQPLARYKEHDIFAVIDMGDSITLEQVEVALKIGRGVCALWIEKASKNGKIGGETKTKTAKKKRAVKGKPTGELQTFSTLRVSPVTGKSFDHLDPHHFSFNTPKGWCEECRGYGYTRVQTGTKRRRGRANEYNSKMEEELAEERLHGKNDEVESSLCEACHGARLREDSRHVLVHGASVYTLVQSSVGEAKEMLRQWEFEGREALIARDVVPEIIQRLEFLESVGLGYLSLDRSADTLSGGESQRIRLAAQLGSNLRGVLYVLDEPTIGLHPRDNQQLLDTLDLLKSRGNSLIVVEHDEETMKRADYLIDLGPGAGVLGGEVMAEMPGKALEQKTALKKYPNSPTLRALSEPLEHPLRKKRRSLPKASDSTAWLVLEGCHYNNLKDIDVRMAKSRLNAISGVSGCGKSSFMRGTLALAAKGKVAAKEKSWKKAKGFTEIKHCFEVDQTPIGKTSRSCPATYVKIFDEIRKLYGRLPESQVRGFSASRFSFNNAEGQCSECKGNGRMKQEMDFLPTVWIPCQHCDEMRYNAATLEVLYQGKSIGDVLQMNISEAAEFFSAHSKLHRVLSLLDETGLGYLQLGQASPTLSGGEAQRIKLVAELVKGRAKIKTTKANYHNLYLIEEPTIGLHQDDVRKLIEVLHQLVDEGHTVVVIEHNTAILSEADYLIDMGPEAGEAGGKIVAQGSPEKVAKSKTSRTAPFLQHLLA